MGPERPAQRLRFADGGVLDLGERTAVMGILNVTPDSFSDGGVHDDPPRALRAAAAMVQAGADILDVGGESTRPGAAPVPDDEEIRRVVPVIEGIRREMRVRVSVDTQTARVARAALDAGAELVNDVSGLSDPAMLPLLCRRRVPLVIMHRRGTPETMQRDTRYDDVVHEVAVFLADKIADAAAAGLGDDKIVVDPGIGFGKSAAGSLALLRGLDRLQALGRPILIGASRKNFIGAVLDLPVEDRLEGSLAVAAFACSRGARVLRVHDVAATVRTVRMIDAIRNDG